MEVLPDTWARTGIISRPLTNVTYWVVFVEFDETFMVFDERVIVVFCEVGARDTSVSCGYALTGSGALDEGQELMKVEAMVKTGFNPRGVPKTLAMGISPTAPRVAA